MLLFSCPFILNVVVEAKFKFPAVSFSAFYHLASPRSRGLFRRIIGQSGMGGLSPGFHQNSPQDAVRLNHRAEKYIERGPFVSTCARAGVGVLCTEWVANSCSINVASLKTGRYPHSLSTPFLPLLIISRFNTEAQQRWRGSVIYCRYKIYTWVRPQR
jgi:hypothetical protein